MTTRVFLSVAICALLLVLGCEPKLVVGKWNCAAGGEVDGNALTTTAPVALPWSTGFENGFCDYTDVAGFCYSDARAAYELVQSPVHAGRLAASFTVTADGALDGLQSRCVRQGQLPDAAFYSAFYFIPSPPSAVNGWNLWHFRGGDATALHGLWDVSLALQADGSLKVYVFDFLRMTTRATSGIPAVPIGAWFQLEVYLKRASDATGEFALYQDGELGLDLTGLSTDDSQYAQWYLGNSAISQTPAASTLYVDDVSISAVP